MRIFLVVLLTSALMASTGFAEENTEDIRTLSTEELEERIESVDKEIREVKVQAEYLRTEPPNLLYDPVEVERTGFGGAGQIKSELLSQNGEYDVEKRLKELRFIKEEIEMELDDRDRQAAQDGSQ